MRPEFQQHNLFAKGIAHFTSHDPNLSYLESLKYVMEPPLLDEIPLHTPGIYILTGARQVGKSTLLKLLIKKLLTQNTCHPEQVLYLPCDIIVDFRELINEIEHWLAGLAKESFFYLFIDEVTYVRDWDRAIKYFADLGVFRRGSVLITGSDSTILQEGMKRFPGRRGVAPETDFHYYPLSFSQYVSLVNPSLWTDVLPLHRAGYGLLNDSAQTRFSQLESLVPADCAMELETLFNRYVTTGGFLTAINEFAANGNIGRYVYNTYIQWIIGDFLKRNKKESTLREIILAVSDRLGTQTGFQNITSATTIQSHSTTQDYLQVLVNMDVLFFLEALREDRLRGAPKKAKKIHFSDPFIAGALICWAKGEHDYWKFIEKNIVAENRLKSQVVEGVMASLFRRKFTSFYIKAEGEVDLAIIRGKSFLPIEIKNSANLKRNDLKQIFKYNSGLIAYRGAEIGQFDHLHVLPLPFLALLV